MPARPGLVNAVIQMESGEGKPDGLPGNDGRQPGGRWPQARPASLPGPGTRGGNASPAKQRLGVMDNKHIIILYCYIYIIL